MMIAGEHAINIAAPHPCSPLEAIRKKGVWAILHNKEPTEKTKNPDVYIILLPCVSLSLPKVIQTLGFEKYNIEYAYTEKREGKLGLYGEQAEKCRGKHILFIEDIFNNGTSLGELTKEIEEKTEDLELKGFSVIYGVHRGHKFAEKPEGEIYAMSQIFAPAVHQSQLSPEILARPLKEYKK